MSQPRVSVVIRAKDEASAIGRTLDLLGRQTVTARGESEVLVVDSGSSDGTDGIARRAGARVIAIPPESFTFGGALNAGCEAARGELLVALSAHAFPPDDAWLERLLEPFEDERVACSSGSDLGPDGAPLLRRVTQDQELACRYPLWGYSSAAGAFRAALWRERPFQSDMPGTEDKEWAWHWLHRGWLAVIGPDLVTDHDHGHDPLRQIFVRARREWAGYGAFLSLEPYRARELLREWWTEEETYASRLRARLSYRRAARLTGKYAGRRSRAGNRRSLSLTVMVDSFPVLSESFVTAEVAELRRQGHGVAVEAIAPTRTPNWDAAEGVPVHFMSDEPVIRKLWDLACLACRHPLRCLRDLLERRTWKRQETVRPLRALAGRARRIHRQGAGHLHVHFARDSALDAMRIGRILAVPYSVTAHAFDVFVEPRNLELKLARAAFAASVCNYTVAHLRHIASAADAAKIRTLTMGVDVERFRRTTPYAGGRTVVAVGRLIEKKGFRHLIEAVSHLEESSPLERVVIAGEGPLRPELEDQLGRLGLKDRIALPGALRPDEVRQLLEAADVFVMPSVIAADGDRDSMPVVVFEALALELPVVASDEVGLPEHVRPGWGRLTPPGESRALAEALGDVLALPVGERTAMGRDGRRWVVEHCDVRSCTARLVELIRHPDPD